MQPKSNKYTSWYLRLIEKRRVEPLSKDKGYCENHHIVPKSLGGKNTKENMILLTAREHYVAHLLLTKMYDGDAKKKMHFAFHSMRRRKNGMQRYEPNSHIYEILAMKLDRRPTAETRLRMSIAAKRKAPMSETHREAIRLGVKASYTPELRARRSAFFKGKKFSAEHRRNLAAGQKGKKMPQGFIDYCRQRRGEKSPKSKTWTLRAPNGEIFTTRAMNDFCLKNGLSYSAFRNRSRVNDPTPIQKGPSKDWSVIRCE